jgi:hypothetical protein
MKHLFLKFFLGTGIVAAMILSLSTYTFAAIGDTGKPLAEIETILQGIETRKVVEPNNDDPIEKLLDEFIAGVKRERIAAKGNKNKLTELQNALKKHTERLKIIENRMKNIEGKIKGGEIKLSKPILQTMNQTEIGEFRKFLTPGALNEYEKLHPEFFKPKAPPRTTPPTKGMKQDIPNDDNISVVQDFLNLLPDLVTPAYATNCETCDGMVRDCKNKCCRCKWYRPWCCVCRSACTGVFAWCYVGCVVMDVVE